MTDLLLDLALAGLVLLAAMLMRRSTQPPNQPDRESRPAWPKIMTLTLLGFGGIVALVDIGLRDLLLPSGTRAAILFIGLPAILVGLVWLISRARFH